MISWHGIHGEQFEMIVLGYESPTIKEGYDANWIKIGIKAKNETGSWEGTAVCFTSWGLEWFCNWLIAVKEGLQKLIFRF